MLMLMLVLVLVLMLRLVLLFVLGQISSKNNKPAAPPP
jgi:hypothetical protein